MHWGTVLLFICNYVSILVHSKLESTTGCHHFREDPDGHAGNRQSRDPEEFLCHHGADRPPDSEIYWGLPRGHGLLFLTKPSDLRAQRKTAGKEISPCRRTLWRHLFLHSLWIFQVNAAKDEVVRREARF